MIFGSAFNPPTLAHEAIIRICLELPQFDEIWLMPSGDRLDKITGVSDEHRLRMSKILATRIFPGEKRVRVTDFELKLPRPTQTYQTSRALSLAYPDANFWWAIGTDSYFSMPEWEHGAELQQNLNLLVFDSGARNKIKRGNVTHLYLPDAVSDVSSTHVRKLAAAGGDLDGLVRPPIVRYIARHGLYK